MRTDREKIIKICLAAPLGLLASHLLGYTDVITASVSMLLVCNYGAGSAWRAAAVYSGKRVAAQAVIGCFAALSVTLFAHIPGLPHWAVLPLASAAAMPAVLLLDDRFRYASAFLLTPAVGFLVMAAGFLQTPAYPLRRLLLVAVGCAMGLLLNMAFSLRTLGRCRRELGELLTLERSMAALLRGGAAPPEWGGSLARYGRLHGALLRESEILLQNRGRRPEAEELRRMVTFCRVQAALTEALRAAEGARQPAPPERREWLAFLCLLMERAQGLLSAQDEGAGLLPPSPAWAGLRAEADIVLAGRILEYRDRLARAIAAEKSEKS